MKAFLSILCLSTQAEFDTLCMIVIFLTSIMQSTLSFDMKTLSRFLLLVLLVLSMPVDAQEAVKSEKAWIFTYFTDNGQDGLHLAWSRDALNWKPLKDGKSFLKPTVSEDKLMRDPSVCRGPDGTFHLVWTVSWKAREIGYASSKDLIEWTPQRAIPVMIHEPATRNTWAPEVFYDDKSETYYIVWASTIPGRFQETAGSSETDYNHRMYYTTTRDFKTFAETKLYWNPDHNVIDTFLARDGDRYLLFYKDETLKPEAKKNISLAIGPSPTGPFEIQGVISHMNWVEGPTALKVDDFWIVYYDCYTKKHYGAVRSKDLKTWENVTEKLSFPIGTRHGTAFEIDEPLLKKLLEVRP